MVARPIIQSNDQDSPGLSGEGISPRGNQFPIRFAGWDCHYRKPLAFEGLQLIFQGFHVETHSS